MLKNLAAVSTLVIPFLFFPTQAQASVALQSLRVVLCFPLLIQRT